MTYPKPLARPSFETRFDRRSFGEPLRALRAVLIQDAGEPLVDVRDACPAVRALPGCLPLLRVTVAAMLQSAALALPHGHTLTTGTCLRTRAMQRGIRERFTKEMTAAHPEWSQATLQRMLNRMVAPPDDVSPPPHLTGGAVDVGILGPDGQALDFSSPTERWDGAVTYCHLLSPAARDNRLMLIGAMEGAGLTNYLGEWWHWSYGDQGWALRVGMNYALYDAVEVENADALCVPKPEEAEVAPSPQ